MAFAQSQSARNLRHCHTQIIKAKRNFQRPKRDAEEEEGNRNERRKTKDERRHYWQGNESSGVKN